MTHKLRKRKASEKFKHFAGISFALVLAAALVILSGCAATDGSIPVSPASENIQVGSSAGGAENDASTTPEKPTRGIGVAPPIIGIPSITVSVEELVILTGDTYYITPAGAPALAGYNPMDYIVEFTLTNGSKADLSGLSTALMSVLKRAAPDFDISQPDDAKLAAGGTPYNSTTFAVTPVSGLAPGTYTDVVRISYDNDLDAVAEEFVFEVSFTVAAPIVDAETPSIDSQPQGITVLTGGTADLLVAASVTDGGTLSYQWFSNTTNSNTGGTLIPGAQGTIFAAPTGTTGTFHYYVVVTNTNAAVNGTQTADAVSNAATVVVNTAPVAPSITTADNASFTFGLGGNFQVAATGTAPVTFSLSGAPAAVTINNTTGLIAVAPTVPAGTYTFAITAGNGISPNATQNFTLTINRAPVAHAGVNIVAPVSGNAPVTAAIITIGIGQFSAGPVTWSPGATAFAGDTQYTASVTLTAGENNTFTNGLAGLATINGNIAAITNNTGTAVTLSFQFPATAPQAPGTDVTPTTGLVPADGGSVMVGFSQTGTIVTLDLNQSIINELINNVEGNNVNIDITSRLSATETVKPVTALTQLAEAGLSLELLLPQGTAFFDAPALTSITEQAEGENISLLLNQIDRTDLALPQRNALNSGDIVFSIRLASGSQTIRSFGGAMTVTVPYSGPTPVAVWYLDDTGNMERLISSLDPATGLVSFTTNHLSFYVLGPDPYAVSDNGPGAGVAGNGGTGTPDQPARTSGYQPLILIIICAAVVAALFIIRMVRARKR